MISAKAFANQASVWHRVTPALEHFTRWVNGNLTRTGMNVRRFGAQDRAAFIAETAFEALARDSEPSLEVQDSVYKVLGGLPRAPDDEQRLSAIEKIEADDIVANLRSYLETLDERVEFRPKFPGCGTVEAARGDMLAGSKLIEVKTVQRGFRGTDFRQALTYAALAYADSVNLTNITLLNPRRGVYFSDDVQELALDLGAGSWVDLMQELLNLMSGLDVST
ncbi:MAG: hypothetical protein ACRCYU_03100 [Nocardioides sp.]